MKFLNLTDKAILDIVTPIAEYTENGWNENNYEMFCQHLLDDPKHKFTLENFNEQIDRNYDRLGNHTIIEFVTLHRNPENVVVIWKINFEKRKEPGLIVYRFTEHEEKAVISGCTFHD